MVKQTPDGSATGYLYDQKRLLLITSGLFVKSLLSRKPPGIAGKSPAAPAKGSPSPSEGSPAAEIVKGSTELTPSAKTAGTSDPATPSAKPADTTVAKPADVTSVAGKQGLSQLDHEGKLTGKPADPERVAKDVNGGLKHEIEAAKIMSKNKLDVEQNPTDYPNEPGDKLTPDYKINNSTYADCYSPKELNSRTIWETINGKAVTYRDGTVVVNLNNLKEPMQPADLLRTLDLKNYPMPKLKTLIIIKGEQMEIHNY